MNSPTTTGSAKILEFTRRNPVTGFMQGRGSGKVVELHPQRFVGVECGSGWYHEAAMQEAAQAPRR